MQEAGERAIELVSELGKRDDLSHLLVNDATCLKSAGRCAAAEVVCERALGVATASGHKTAMIRARARHAEVLEVRGHLAQALDEIDRAAPEADRVGDTATRTACAKCRARVLSTLGRTAEAQAALDAVRDTLLEWSGKAGPASPALLAIQGRNLENQDRCEDALELYHRAHERLAESGQPYPDAPLALGRAYARIGDTERARTFLQEAVELGRDLDMAGVEALANAYRAALPGGTPLAAAILLERHEGALPLTDRLEARFALWDATGDLDHLRRAHEHVEDLVDHAPEADRAKMQRAVLPLRRVADAMRPYLLDVFGNPSSTHPQGRLAREAIDLARARVAAGIGASPTEVVFTSGGTESNNRENRPQPEAGRDLVVVGGRDGCREPPSRPMAPYACACRHDLQPVGREAEEGILPVLRA